MGLNLILFILLYLDPEEVSSDWSHNAFDLAEPLYRSSGQFYQFDILGWLGAALD
jgi:hypothetical protein